MISLGRHTLLRDSTPAHLLASRPSPVTYS
ncbi:hypothetical protein E2C01_100885 [Portunus trituberculatus]|uniref:Uncharacterized protein n=1 Tax=Portunus trituberculatus TaxID=210409 RepID=A0A5B7KEG8_PORTR|nr:hypothetical protein [Portunus trituberculatus]